MPLGSGGGGGRSQSHLPPKQRNSALFNVKSFGARADGRTDDSKKQADVNCGLLLLALLCHMLPLMFGYSRQSESLTVDSTLALSRVSNIVMLIAYDAYLVF